MKTTNEMRTIPIMQFSLISSIRFLLIFAFRGVTEFLLRSSALFMLTSGQFVESEFVLLGFESGPTTRDLQVYRSRLAIEDIRKQNACQMI